MSVQQQNLLFPAGVIKYYEPEKNEIWTDTDVTGFSALQFMQLILIFINFFQHIFFIKVDHLEEGVSKRHLKHYFDLIKHCVFNYEKVKLCKFFSVTFVVSQDLSTRKNSLYLFLKIIAYPFGKIQSVSIRFWNHQIGGIRYISH